MPKMKTKRAAAKRLRKKRRDTGVAAPDTKEALRLLGKR